MSTPEEETTQTDLLSEAQVAALHEESRWFYRYRKFHTLPETPISPTIIRQWFQMFIGFHKRFPGPAGVTVTDVLPPSITPEGPNVPLRIYAPDSAGPASTVPVVLFLHGGLFVAGHLDNDHAYCMALCAALNAVVVHVDFHVPPEHPYPAPLDDALAALTWIVEGGVAEAGGDPSRLVVMGSSTGGVVAVALSVAWRRSPISLLVLLTPVLSPDMNTESYRECHNSFLCPRSQLAWAWKQFLLRFEDVSAEKRQFVLSPDPQSLPKRVLVLTAQFDCCRSEAEDFAQKVSGAGGTVRLVNVAGMEHGFHTNFAFTLSRKDVLTAIATEVAETFGLSRLECLYPPSWDKFAEDFLGLLRQIVTGQEEADFIPDDLDEADDVVTPLGVTALYVAAERAAENDHPTPLFRDPFARELAGRAGYKFLAKLKKLYGSVASPIFAVRTRFLDDFLMKQALSGVSQIVSVASGVDTRPWRLEWPQGTHFYEVDFADVQAWKRKKMAKYEPKCILHSVDADLCKKDWTVSLVAAGFDRSKPTAWLVEGLLFYLKEEDVKTLLQTISENSVCGSAICGDWPSEGYLTFPAMQSSRKLFHDEGCPIQFGHNWPEQFIGQHGWNVEAFMYGDEEANYDRIPESISRARIDYPRGSEHSKNYPHCFLYRATREDP